MPRAYYSRRRFSRGSRKLWTRSCIYVNVAAATTQTDQNILVNSSSATTPLRVKVLGAQFQFISATATAQTITVVITKGVGLQAPVIQQSNAADVAPYATNNLLACTSFQLPATANSTTVPLWMVWQRRSAVLQPGEGIYLSVLSNQTVASDAVVGTVSVASTSA